jgi:quercetin dioxygenase-like cupin family protein
MKSRTRRKRSLQFLGFTIVLVTIIALSPFAVVVYSSISQIIATGTMAYSELFGGPATVTVRRLTITPGEVLGWHYHPGIGAYVVVNQGTLIVEDGCGGETPYTAGQAFLEQPNRVHRGKNLTGQDVETVSTYVVPLGTPFTVPTQRLCGAPAHVDECKDGGWTSFDHPRTFNSQGDCMQFVLTDK